MNLLIEITLICCIALLSCGKKEPPSPISDTEIAAIIDKVKNLPNEPVNQGEVATIETTLGTIKFRFFTDAAPNTSANFKKLANAGFYDGTIFHRTIPDFMIQGGDIMTRDANPGNDGTGDPGYKINAEFNSNSHTPGRVSMARSQDPNSAGSQFFICHGSPTFLDGQYTVFGEVSEGMEVVDKIARAETEKAGEGSRPVNPVVMLEVRVN